MEVSGRFNILPILVLSLKKRNIKILDYGGGANPAYSYIENSTKIKTKTCVIEQENFCRIIKNKVPKNLKQEVLKINSNQKYDQLVKELKDIKLDAEGNYILYQLLEETSYLETAYNEIRESLDAMEDELKNENLKNPMIKAIVEEWKNTTN